MIFMHEYIVRLYVLSDDDKPHKIWMSYAHTWYSDSTDYLQAYYDMCVHYANFGEYIVNATYCGMPNYYHDNERVYN